jgi:capsular exopolysaccharide synthesis family protein
MNDQASWPNGNPKAGGQLVPAAQTLPAMLDPYGPLAGYGGAAANAPELLGLKLFEIWRILNKRKWLILSIVAACLALNAVRTLMQTPIYSATVRLQIDPVSNLVTRDENQYDGSDFMKTQQQIIQSRLMAERVALTLKLGEDANFFRPRSFSIVSAVMRMFSSVPSPGDKGGANRQSAASDIVAANVATAPLPDTRLIDISYSDPDRGRAQRIANAYADAFVATTIDKRFQANASAKIFLEDKVQQLKLRLEESEKKLLEFAQQQQIVASEGDKASIAETNLAAANAELGILISERTKNEQLWRQLKEANAISLPQLLSNSVIENLRSQRKALALDYQEKSQTFKPSYPAMVQINSRIEEIDKLLASEVQTIRDSLKAGYEASLARENDLKERIQVLKQEVLDLQNRSIRYNILKREVDTNRELYTSLLQRYKEADVAGGVGANNIFVVDKAGLPGSPSSPNLSRALVLALMLGLVAGCVVAYGLEFLDDKVRSVEQVESIAGLPVLGVIPKCDDLVGELADPRSAVAEAYRTLCTSLLFASENGLPKTLLITSSTPSEGKSSTATSIAKHFAMLDRKVLLIDADLRNPSLHVKLNRDNSIGLSNCLTGACTPPEAMQSTETPNWAFMASGPLPPNAADLLGGSRLHSLLSIGGEVFDLIVIDGPPVLGLADAQILASAAAATIFVVGAGQVRPGFVRGALRHLQLSRASVIGAVLTKHDARGAGYGYSYGYSYGYGYGYGHSYGHDHRSAADSHGLTVRISALDKPPPQLTDRQRNA